MVLASITIAARRQSKHKSAGKRASTGIDLDTEKSDDHPPHEVWYRVLELQAVGNTLLLSKMLHA
ncbi:hypothetical protein [Paenibacillus xylanexedens]|uniref:hypothetical protein n=1 Tax=Paenibacillus xylanexedens TaxID=528191 RepID=UPI00119D165A|nr:hypothetical protein [Paenibacillus xylanexedens]